MNKYDEMKKRHSEDVNKFPFGFAFSEEQFKTMMGKLGLKKTDTDKIVSINHGGFVRKDDIEAMEKMFDDHKTELWNAINSDKNGNDFIVDMFTSELENHEYIVTYSITDTLNALGITKKDLEKNSNLENGLNSAKEIVIDKYEIKI